MTEPRRGTVYRCPVCQAEIAVLAPFHGEFVPRCCNTAMVRCRRRLVFYVCPVCGAEVALLVTASGVFRPRCCNREMTREAA